MENWRECKLEDIIEFNPKETIQKGSIAKKIEMSQLIPFCRDVIGYTKEIFYSGTKFRNGDTIMARITPCLENGKTAKISLLNDNEIGFGSTEYIILRAKKEISDADYIYYLATSSFVRECAIKSMVGSSGRQRVQLDVVKNLEISCPSYTEQQKIAKLLRLLDDEIELKRQINTNLLLSRGLLILSRSAAQCRMIGKKLVCLILLIIRMDLQCKNIGQPVMSKEFLL